MLSRKRHRSRTRGRRLSTQNTHEDTQTPTEHAARDTELDSLNAQEGYEVPDCNRDSQDQATGESGDDTEAPEPSYEGTRGQNVQLSPKDHRHSGTSIGDQATLAVDRGLSPRPRRPASNKTRLGLEPGLLYYNGVERQPRSRR